MLILSDFLLRGFCLSARRRPPEPRMWTSDASSDVSDFLVREARTTLRTRKSVRVTTAFGVTTELITGKSQQQLRDMS